MAGTGDQPRLVVSHLRLRQAIGILGVLLPLMLAIGCTLFGSCVELQNSISDYYATSARDVFVGVLFAIGCFLASYRGYERKDDIAGDVACICALGVALFPNTHPSAFVRTVHFASAACLFVTLSYFSLRLFTKTQPGVPPTPEKIVRNRVYRGCGAAMLLCVGAIPLYYAFFTGTAVAAWKPVFWLESAALWAFGFSWITKGEMLWKDAGPI